MNRDAAYWHPITMALGFELLADYWVINRGLWFWCPRTNTDLTAIEAMITVADETNHVTDDGEHDEHHEHLRGPRRHANTYPADPNVAAPWNQYTPSTWLELHRPFAAKARLRLRAREAAARNATEPVSQRHPALVA